MLLSTLRTFPRALGLCAVRVSSPVETAAALLAKGEVLAFAQGRFERGPRALDQRSLPVDVLIQR